MSNIQAYKQSQNPTIFSGNGPSNISMQNFQTAQLGNAATFGDLSGGA